MHNDYWVAVSAAAPLIGVAQVVNLSRYLAWNTAALEGRRSAIVALGRLAADAERDKRKIADDLPHMDLSDREAAVQAILVRLQESVDRENQRINNAIVWSANPVITRLMLGFSVLSGLLAALITVIALASLGAEHDEWSPGVTTVLAGIATGCFFLQGALEYLGRSRGLNPTE